MQLNNQRGARGYEIASGIVGSSSIKEHVTELLETQE